MSAVELLLFLAFTLGLIALAGRGVRALLHHLGDDGPWPFDPDAPSDIDCM